jgi:predicted Zn-dependent protease
MVACLRLFHKITAQTFLVALALLCLCASESRLNAKEIAKSVENPELKSAVTLYDAGRNWAALPILQRATDSTPEDYQSWLYLARVYQNIGKLDKAVASYDKYFALAPKSEERDKYLAFMDVLKSQLASQKKAISTKAPGNYLSLVTPNGVFKWASEKMPITVSIGSGSKVPGYSTDFDEAFRSALDEWEMKSNGLVSFKIVDSPDKSDMDVTWTDNLHSKALSAEAGNTSIICGAQGILKARMTLLTIDPFERGRARGKRQLRNICLHEIGHALGLNGHSGYPEDIMHSQLIVQDGVSPRDLNTLKMLYAESAKSE